MNLSNFNFISASQNNKKLKKKTLNWPWKCSTFHLLVLDCSSDVAWATSTQRHSMFSLLNNDLIVQPIGTARIHTQTHTHTVCCDLYINYVEPLHDWLAYKIGFFSIDLFRLCISHFHRLFLLLEMLFARSITNTFSPNVTVIYTFIYVYREKRISALKRVSVVGLTVLCGSPIWRLLLSYGMKPMPTICVCVHTFLMWPTNELNTSKWQRISMQIHTFALWIPNVNP